MDDFFLAGPNQSDICKNSIQTITSLFSRLGVPLAPEKVEGPTNVLTYLGIVIDTNLMELRLPEDKLSALVDLLSAWQIKRKCTRRELLSLIGKLSFASKIIPSGRTFLRRLIHLSKSVTSLNHRVCLNLDARKDIEWWKEFLPSWNGKYKILDPQSTFAHDLNLFTDASWSLGFGAYFNGKWVSSPWPQSLKSFSIQWKKLFPIYVA